MTDEHGQHDDVHPSGRRRERQPADRASPTPAATSTRYAYDAAGNLTATTYADGTVERVAYDAPGNPTSLTNRRGQAIDADLQRRRAGDAARPIPDGSATDYTYDARGRLRTATDARGHDHVHLRHRRPARPGRLPQRPLAGLHLRRGRPADPAGGQQRLRASTTATTRPAGWRTLRDGADALIVRYTYDAAGRLSREDKGNGTYTIYAYDAAGRIETSSTTRRTGRSTPASTTPTTPLGRRTGMTTLDGTWTYTYDLTGQLTRAVFASTNPAIPNQDLTYDYDAAGNRVRTVAERRDDRLRHQQPEPVHRGRGDRPTATTSTAT